MSCFSAGTDGKCMMEGADSMMPKCSEADMNPTNKKMYNISDSGKVMCFVCTCS